MMNLDLKAVQAYLRDAGLDAWLLYDFRGVNQIAQDLAPFEGLLSRRWYLLIPAQGTPILLAHWIEAAGIKGEWMEKRLYTGRVRLEEELKKLLTGFKTVAMEYSALCNIPYVSRVDAGTIEMIRSHGVDIRSSANLVQHFSARWNEQQLASHKVAANFLVNLMQDMFAWVADRMKKGKTLDEYQVQQEILRRFRELGMWADDEPNCSCGIHSAMPHYAPTSEEFAPLVRGELLLLDIWCRQQSEQTIMADITQTAWLGEGTAPREMREVFDIVSRARDAGVEFAGRRLFQGHEVAGWEIDDVVRKVIVDAGYGEHFTHRTGHSLGTMVHGNGVNIDNFETKDERILEPGLGFTIEPGIYLPGKFGIRSEINCYVSNKGLDVTTLPLQTELKGIL